MTKKELFYPAGSLIMAPLSGFTDLPYRRALIRQGCRYAFTEMVDVSSLAYAHEKSHRMLERGVEESFLGCQLVGSDPEHTRKAVEAVNQYQFDILDFNLGCPVPKVAKKGAGAALGRDIAKALSLFAVIKVHSRFPVSAKIRILNADDVMPTLELVQGLFELGAVAVTIHGRIKEAFYSGPVAMDQIRFCRQNAQGQIVANGGVNTLTSYQTLREESGCEAVMLARGAMGNPYLFREIAEGKEFKPPTMEELIDDMSRHIKEIVDYYGEEAGMRIARKIIHDYLRGRGFHSNCRAEASQLATWREFTAFLSMIAVNHSGESYWNHLAKHPDSERRLSPANGI